MNFSKAGLGVRGGCFSLCHRRIWQRCHSSRPHTHARLQPLLAACTPLPGTHREPPPSSSPLQARVLGRPRWGLTAGATAPLRRELKGREPPTAWGAYKSSCRRCPEPCFSLPHQPTSAAALSKAGRRQRRTPGPWPMHPILQGGPIPWPCPLGVSHHEDSQGGLRSTPP